MCGRKTGRALGGAEDGHRDHRRDADGQRSRGESEGPADREVEALELHRIFPRREAEGGIVSADSDPEGRGLLGYDRAAVAAGERWRLVTAHLAHLSVRHGLMNVAALAMIASGDEAPLQDHLNELVTLVLPLLELWDRCNDSPLEISINTLRHKLGVD